MEGNKIIAEFMGLETPDSVYFECLTKDGERSKLTHFILLEYHLSWNWLMPVVEKIERLGYEVEIRNTDCIIFQLLDTIKYKPIVDISSGNGKKDSTYIAVVKFINEYNQNN